MVRAQSYSTLQKKGSFSADHLGAIANGRGRDTGIGIWGKYDKAGHTFDTTNRLFPDLGPNVTDNFSRSLGQRSWAESMVGYSQQMAIKARKIITIVY